MNPNNPEYSYNMFWSYLHGMYVLFLEDDRPFIQDIETKIYFSNFIEEAIVILNNTNDVKGIILKQDGEGKAIRKEIYTSMGSHIFFILIDPPLGYYYTNGPSVYKVEHLLEAGSFESEWNMALQFKRRKWFTGFTYKGIKCNNTNIFSTECQGVSYHFGKKYSTLYEKERKMCNIYLY